MMALAKNAEEVLPPGQRAAAGPSLSPADFSARFQDAYRTLWLIAAGVLGQRTDADDILQDAAMVGLQKLGDFDPATNFSAWMGGIVRNIARNHARKIRRRQTSPADPAAMDQSRAAPVSPDPPAAHPAPQTPILSSDQAHFDDRLLSALQNLEETPRTCLLLRTLHDMPYREIALWLDIPEGTAMSHVHRARHNLRRQLASRLDDRSLA
jgi:RNA polymerase sigma-70 factor, ECF subfamily